MSISVFYTPDEIKICINLITKVRKCQYVYFDFGVLLLNKYKSKMLQDIMSEKPACHFTHDFDHALRKVGKLPYGLTTCTHYAHMV